MMHATGLGPGRAPGRGRPRRPAAWRARCWPDLRDGAHAPWRPREARAPPRHSPPRKSSRSCPRTCRQPGGPARGHAPRSSTTPTFLEFKALLRRGHAVRPRAPGRACRGHDRQQRPDRRGRRRTRPRTSSSWLCQRGTPLVYLQNTTGYMVGRDSERGRHDQARHAR
jgi:hypothetical protein